MDPKKYPKLCRALAGTAGNESFEALAEEVEKDPQKLFEEYVEGTDEDTLQEIEDSLATNETLFESWGWEVPLEGDIEEFDNLVEENESIKTLYNLIAEFDGGEKWGEY